MAHTALTKALTRLGSLRSTRRIAGNLSLRRTATAKAFPPRPSTRRLGVLAGPPVQDNNCITAYRHYVTRDRSHQPAQPSLSRLSSIVASNGDNNHNNVNNKSRNSAATNTAAADLRATPDLLQGIGEALTLEDLESSAPWGLAVGPRRVPHHVRRRRGVGPHEGRAVEGGGECLYGCVDSLLPRLSHALIEDRATLGGAGVRHVRRRFTAWAGVEGPGYFAGTRYNYCLLVDEVCLESLDRIASPVVKLVKKNFTDEEGGGGGRSGVVASPGWEDGVTDSEEEDVGWMYLPVADYVDCCNQLHDPEFWHDGYYVRPPLTFLNRDFASAPGFWRREGHEV